MKKLGVYIIFCILPGYLYAAESFNVMEQMKLEFTTCISAQIKVSDTYNTLNDKNLESISEIKQVKAYYKSLTEMIKNCQKVYAFHEEVEEGISIQKLVYDAINSLERQKSF